MAEKSSMLQVRVEDTFIAMIRRRAKENNMCAADYIRHCVLLDSVADGDIEAMKICGRSLKAKLSHALFMFDKKHKISS